MSDMNRQQFLRTLIQGNTDRQDPETKDQEFVCALMRFGSDTDDNAQCVDRVGIGCFQDAAGKWRIGPKLRNAEISVADLLNRVEGMPIPPQLTEEYPSVSQEDWDAVLRLAVLTLVACESSHGRPDLTEQVPLKQPDML